MKKKGKILWVPATTINELTNIKKENNLHKDSDAFRRMEEFSRVGREARKMMFAFGLNPDKKKKK